MKHFSRHTTQYQLMLRTVDYKENKFASAAHYVSRLSRSLRYLPVRTQHMIRLFFSEACSIASRAP
jgi:hypothetical protein